MPKPPGHIGHCPKPESPANSIQDMNINMGEPALQCGRFIDWLNSTIRMVMPPRFINSPPA